MAVPAEPETAWAREGRREEGIVTVELDSMMGDGVGPVMDCLFVKMRLVY